jgi:ribosomal protein S14
MAKFRRAYNVMVRCRCCGKQTHSSIGSGTDLCRVCFDSASYENEHLDSDGHNAPKVCPMCAGVACLHEVAR